MRILILGVSGMLGHTLFLELSRDPELEVFGTVRRLEPLRGCFPLNRLEKIKENINAHDFPSVAGLAAELQPEVIINCIGIIRQLPEARKPLPCIEINARFPHLLHQLAQERKCRLIHYSTDCVFDGHKGSPYREDDPLTAKDLYGITKYLGEVSEAPALTLRTSIIGHELRGKLSLIEWFLSQEGRVNGYTRATYTGLPTCEQARILSEFVLPSPELTGLFQVTSSPISKYELLSLAAREYGKSITIIPDQSVVEDKRLDGGRFRSATGYSAPSWPKLIQDLHESHKKYLKELS
jgi:dTDP-4-dehydrorhamnose reductase